jgi:carbon-monoxide dehydrogenase large subunit
MESGPNESQHFPTIGQPIRRKEDLRLVTGLGRFSDDFNLGGPSLAGVRTLALRTPVLSQSTPMRRAMSGVLGVFSGEDCRRADCARSTTARCRRHATT